MDDIDEILGQYESQPSSSEDDVDAILASYEAPSMDSSTTPQPPKSAIGGFLETSPLAPAKALYDGAEDIKNYLGGLSLDDLKTAPKGLWEASKGIGEGLLEVGKAAMKPITGIPAQMGNLAEAGQALVRGETGEVYGNLAEAALSTFPLTDTTSKAMLDQSQGGYGTGRAVGEVASLGLTALGPATKALGAPLKEAAKSRYASAFRSTKGNRKLADAAADQALERGIYGPLEDAWYKPSSLASQGRELMEEAGPKIQRLYDVPDPVDISKAVLALDELPKKSVIAGVQKKPSLAEAAAAEIFDLNRQTKGSDLLPASDAWALKKQLQRDVADARGYAKIDNPKQARAEIDAKRAEAQGLREALEAKFTESKSLNSDYSFGSDLQKLTKDAKVGPSFWGSVKQGGITAGALAKVQAIIQSPLFKTFSAVKQAKVAKLLESGQISEALQALGLSSEVLGALEPKEGL
jgi:hypothetical protein